MEAPQIVAALRREHGECGGEGMGACHLRFLTEEDVQEILNLASKEEAVKHVMCATCGFETDSYTKVVADRKHLEFDPAHEALWYEDGDADKPVW